MNPEAQKVALLERAGISKEAREAALNERKNYPEPEASFESGYHVQQLLNSSIAKLVAEREKMLQELQQARQEWTRYSQLAESAEAVFIENCKEISLLRAKIAFEVNWREEEAARAVAAREELRDQLRQVMEELNRERGTRMANFTLAKTGRVIQIPVYDLNGYEMLAVEAHQKINFEKVIDQRSDAESQLSQWQECANEMATILSQNYHDSGPGPNHLIQCALNLFTKLTSTIIEKQN